MLDTWDSSYDSYDYHILKNSGDEFLRVELEELRSGFNVNKDIYENEGDDEEFPINVFKLL